MFSFALSDELTKNVKVLAKRDPVFCDALNKKIKEIVMNDLQTIGRYKNLRNDLSDNKRVHVNKSFVLTFRVRRDIRFIYFEKLLHHDDIYRR